MVKEGCVLRASNGDHLEGDGKENPMHVVAKNGDHFEEMCLAVAGGGTGGQHGLVGSGAIRR